MENNDKRSIDIPDDDPIAESLRQIAHDIRLFVELSLHEDDAKWEDWLPLVVKELGVKCWEKKKCAKEGCPAYKNTKVRCWLVAGTMCGGKVQGEFALKYKSCTECDVYQESVFVSPITEIYEHLITLVHNLKTTQDRLKTMATRDLLTGLYNRNYFNETITREIEKAKRYGENLSIIMIDIDKFKYINDTYGHLHGDGILKECASILRKAVRGSDILCRFGGDEFVIVTPETDCRGNNAVVSRINGFISKWNEEYSSPGYELSFSIGCSILKKGKNLLDALHEADILMYENKRKKTMKRNGKPE
jgi:diguanylate cyclase (GGDEF)-like protein